MPLGLYGKPFDLQQHRKTMAWTWIERAHGAKPDDAYRIAQAQVADRLDPDVHYSKCEECWNWESADNTNKKYRPVSEDC